MDAQEPVRAARTPLVEPTQGVEAQPVVEVVSTEPLVEGTGQVALIVEGYGPLVSGQVEM